MARDIEGELDQLRELRDSGALSEGEYRRAKATLGDGTQDSERRDREGALPRSKRSRARSREAAEKRPTANGLYRHGGQLVIREGAKFPDRCVICNKECDADKVEFIFRREKTSHYIEVAAVQFVARAATDLLKGSKYTGPVQATIPLCPWHRGRRLRRILFGVALMGLAIAILFIRYLMVGAREFNVFQISVYSVTAIVAGVAGITVAWASIIDWMRVWFKATKYYDRFVWIQGAGRKFLRGLPALEDYHYKSDRDDPGLSADELIRRARVDD